MIAKISTAQNIKAIIDYNEKKVEKGEARIIGGENMRSEKSAEEMSYEAKLGRFEEIIAGKQNTQHEKVAFHASLSFDPTEKPTDNDLRVIASTYMQHMGYGRQPFLIYRHEDTHHPHIHIVSTTVNKEGKKIDDSFSKYNSEEIRKAIEKEFGLVVAEDKNKVGINELTPVEMVKGVEYGKTEIKKAISDVVRPVVKEFKLTSMQELQLVLGQYNIKGETVRGENKDGKYEGLVFSVTDDKGKRIGTGIKASELYSKTSMHKLNLQFAHNIEPKKEIAKETVKAIEKVFSAHHHISKEDLQEKLKAAGINLQYHEGTKGVFGITVIDNAHKAVFKGSELGKGYSWNNLSTRLSDTTVEKMGIEPLDRESIKKANSALATIYDKLRKDVQTGEFFESQMIRKLNMMDLVTPLLKQMPTLDRLAGEGAVKGYIDYKRGKLEEIEQKEKDYFRSGVETAIKFLDQTPKEKLSEQARIAFLEKNGFTLSRDTKGLYIGHSKGKHLRIAVGEFGSGKHFSGGLLFEGKGMPAYGKTDKAFISAIAGGDTEPKDLSIFNFNYGEFKPLLSEDNASKVAGHLTRSYLSEVMSSGVMGMGGGSLSAEKISRELDKRGLQIIPVVDKGMVQDYRIAYFRMPEGAIGVDTSFRNKLLGEGYVAKPSALTTKYGILVGLTQSEDRKDIKGIDRAVNTIQRINPVFASSLKKELFGLIKGAQTREFSGKEKVLRAAFSLLKEGISAYPNESLREQKQAIGKDKELSLDQSDWTKGEEKEQTKNTLADALSGTNDEGGVESHHRKNKLKRPRIS